MTNVYGVASAVKSIDINRQIIATIPSTPVGTSLFRVERVALHVGHRYSPMRLPQDRGKLTFSYAGYFKNGW